MTKWVFAAIALALNSINANAQNAPALLNFTPGAGPNAGLISTTNLNKMVGVVNALTGNGGGVTLNGYFSDQTSGAGFSTGPTALTGVVIQGVGANAATARIELDAYAGVPIFSAVRRDGTKVSPTAVLSTEQIGSFNFHGASTTALVYGPAARYTAYATENWSSTAGGTKLVLSVTPNTTQTITDAVTINNDSGVVITSASANALTVGLAGTTSPALKVDASTASSATGLQIKSAASGSGIALTALGGTNESIFISAKGAGFTQFGTAAGVPQHVATAQTTAPALTSCGGGSPAITGTDTAGKVTMGTTATGCVITFNVAYTGTPYCVVSWIATPLASQSYTTSNTAITLTQTSTSSNIVQYVCMATAGG